MTITMTSRATCTLCRAHIRGICVASVRVNKASMRSTSPSLVFRDRTCPECGFEAASPPERWTLDEASAEAVAAARVKRGWTA